MATCPIHSNTFTAMQFFRGDLCLLFDTLTINIFNCKKQDIRLVLFQQLSNRDSTVYPDVLYFTSDIFLYVFWAFYTKITKFYQVYGWLIRKTTLTIFNTSFVETLSPYTIEVPQFHKRFTWLLTRAKIKLSSTDWTVKESPGLLLTHKNSHTCT